MYSRGSTGLSTYSQPERKPSKNQRVKVWARVRPTAYFDTEHLELLPDGRVGDIRLWNLPYIGKQQFYFSASFNLQSNLN